MDGDEMFDDALELQWETMVRAGYSKEQIDLVKQRKKDKENARIYGYMVQQHAWEFDISCDRVDVHLKLARALDAICRRSDAIEILREAAEEDHLFDSRILMSLAKLLFRDDQKDLSLFYCQSIIKAYIDKQAGEQCEEGAYISVEDALSSYYLSGWIKIHDDNHTDAYKIWSEGHRAIPSCPVLLKQHRKREYWDQDPAHLEEWLLQIPGLLSVRGTICKEDLEPNSDSRLGLESFSVSSTNVVHPLALFNAETQQRKLIFRTNGDPLMSRAECSSVIDIVEEYHKNILGGKWGTVRKSSVKTTDVAVEDIPVLRPWLLALLHTKLFPLLSLAFPILIDGTTLYDTKTQISRLRVHDAFIVRYDAVNDLSLSLPEHCDTSSMSVIFALNEEERNHIEQDQDDQSQEQNQYEEKRQIHGTYKGGGTWFESLGVQGQVINADIGQAVMFAGPLKHAGYPISAGIRNILVLFLYVEGFHYGPYLQKSRSKVPLLEKVECSEDTLEKKRTSGAETGGFVVYRQTVELVSMLNEVTDRDCLDV